MSRYRQHKETGNCCAIIESTADLSYHELLVLEVGHSSITEWNVMVYDRRGKEPGNWGEPVVHVQGSNRELVFAKAYAELAEYFSEYFGWC